MRAAWLGVALLAACRAPDAPPPTRSIDEPPSPKASLQPPPPDAGTSAVENDAGTPVAEWSLDSARRALFLDEPTGEGIGACEDVPCLLRLRYTFDAEAERVAEDFYATSGGIAGLEAPSNFDGGWRGTIKIVPELPVGKYRRHLVDAAAAVKRLDALIGELAKRAKKPVRYRARGILFRFFRSVGRTTPSAFAETWSIAYNVSGSLLGTSDGVRETLVHEIFHLNDERRAADGENWSVGALGPTFDALIARCGTNASCLSPYAPASTMVKGGTYYAFQPGGGVHEYAAELAVRYVTETEAALGKGPKPAQPFKCGPKENALAWQLIVSEFFGGVDLTPTCAP